MTFNKQIIDCISTSGPIYNANRNPLIAIHVQTYGMFISQAY
jgi:hypothetical protein